MVPSLHQPKARCSPALAVHVEVRRAAERRGIPPAAASQRKSRARAGSSTPPIATGRLVRRRHTVTDGSNRSVSVTAASIRCGCATTIAQRAGSSGRRRTVWPMSLALVSCPANEGARVSSRYLAPGTTAAVGQPVPLTAISATEAAARHSPATRALVSRSVSTARASTIVLAGYSDVITAVMESRPRCVARK
jgi:hypothetical protein